MNSTSMKRLAGAICAAFAATCHSAKAESGPWLFGDWGGERTRLQEQGFDFQFGYVSETAYNARGGTAKDTRYTDQWSLGTTLDLERLFGLPDAKLQFTLTDRNGDNLSDDQDLGTLQQVQEVYGRGNFLRLTDFWYEQGFFGGLVDWKIGRMPVGEDFASFACDFQNLSFCGAAPGNIVGNYWFNWPVSQWATRVKIAGPHDTYVQVGAYEVNPRYLTNRYAFSLSSPPGKTEALIPLEFGWTPTFHGMAGTYKLGGWYNTADSADVYLDVNHQLRALTGGPALERDGAYGGYLLLRQQVLQFGPGEGPERGLSVFFNATKADHHTATVDSQLALGLVAVGLLRQRPSDELGIAVARTHVNSRVEDAQELAGSSALQHSEYASELYYGWQALRGLVFRPNVQFIHDPGGVDDQTDVVVLGLKVVANF